MQIEREDKGSAQSQPGIDAQERSPDQQHSDGWQDIASAPKSGMPIDVWCVPPADCDFEPQEGGVRLTDVSWCLPTETWPHQGWARVTDSGYLDLVDGPPTAPDGLPRWVPTHWRSRPAPPPTAPSSIQVGKAMPYFCPACQAIPDAGFCKLAGCPTAPSNHVGGEG